MNILNTITALVLTTIVSLNNNAFGSVLLEELLHDRIGISQYMLDHVTDCEDLNELQCKALTASDESTVAYMQYQVAMVRVDLINLITYTNMYKQGIEALDGLKRDDQRFIEYPLVTYTDRVKVKLDQIKKTVAMYDLSEDPYASEDVEYIKENPTARYVHAPRISELARYIKTTEDAVLRSTYKKSVKETKMYAHIIKADEALRDLMGQRKLRSNDELIEEISKGSPKQKEYVSDMDFMTQFLIILEAHQRSKAR